MFKWKDSFSVNIEKIDEQHMELFRLGSELYTLISAKDGVDRYDEIMDVVGELANYTVEHFAYEEAMMKTNNYSDLVQHKLQHDAFVGKIKSIKAEEVDLTQRKTAMDLIVFIANWIEKHILGTDMQYKEFLNEKGVF
ncbi:bacteriohemerythrin [Tissierella sp.]|uniref:bacteriohemerythrin n=1 Tax=Tissierella sp. TaxID=41274 RepID=UPI0028643625|nr:bacteriohemerythrin [Tissierella sp.]MDR7855440.1 bacteriohemerythrin [Tissierella sp.]